MVPSLHVWQVTVLSFPALTWELFAQGTAAESQIPGAGPSWSSRCGNRASRHTDCTFRTVTVRRQGSKSFKSVLYFLAVEVCLLDMPGFGRSSINLPLASAQ